MMTEGVRWPAFPCACPSALPPLPFPCPVAGSATYLSAWTVQLPGWPDAVLVERLQPGERNKEGAIRRAVQQLRAANPALVMADAPVGATATPGANQGEEM